MKDIDKFFENYCCKEIEKDKFNNLELDSQFTLGAKKLKVVEHTNCEECFINQSGLFNSCADLQAFDIIPRCLADERKDQRNVMFELDQESDDL